MYFHWCRKLSRISYLCVYIRPCKIKNMANPSCKNMIKHLWITSSTRATTTPIYKNRFLNYDLCERSSTVCIMWSPAIAFYSVSRTSIFCRTNKGRLYIYNIHVIATEFCGHIHNLCDSEFRFATFHSTYI